MFVIRLAFVITVSITAQSRLVKDVCSVPQWEATQATLVGKYVDGVPSITKKTLYTIVDETCNKTLLDRPFKKACVPYDANYSWDMTHYGINHDNMILIWEYRGSRDNVTYIIHTLYDGNPVMEQTYGDYDGVTLFSNSAFLNMTAGIKNPDVFTPPYSCKGVDYQLTQVPDSEKYGVLSF